MLRESSNSPLEIMTMILREYSNIRVFSSSSSSRFLPIFDLEEDDDDSATTNLEREISFKFEIYYSNV